MNHLRDLSLPKSIMPFLNVLPWNTNFYKYILFIKKMPLLRAVIKNENGLIGLTGSYRRIPLSEIQKGFVIKRGWETARDPVESLREKARRSSNLYYKIKRTQRIHDIEVTPYDVYQKRPV